MNETALQINTETGEEYPVASDNQLTPAQSRINAVSRALDAAMSKASMLELTDEQIKILKADFPDEAFRYGAAGKEDLIYIEHFALRNRMDEAIGMGKWALIRTEPYKAEPFKTAKGTDACRVYATCALLVHGCMVSEATGDGTYYLNNDSGNYGDAAEAAMTQAFRRCAKQFGVGLQAWSKTWCEEWTKKHPKGSRTPQSSPQPQKAAPQPPDDGKAEILNKFLKEIAGMDMTALLAITSPPETWTANQREWRSEYGSDGLKAIQDRVKVRGQLLKTMHKPVDPPVVDAEFTAPDEEPTTLDIALADNIHVPNSISEWESLLYLSDTTAGLRAVRELWDKTDTNRYTGAAKKKVLDLFAKQEEILNEIEQ